MQSDSIRPRSPCCLALINAIVGALRTTTTQNELAKLMETVAREMGFRHYALIHHDDLQKERPDRVDLKDYPPAITERLFGQHRYRRDPVIRGCIFADSAFLWSELPHIIRRDRQDHDSFEMGAKEGLNQGITVPYVRLGDRMGSCTFAGTNRPERAHHFLGAAQMIGTFAFQCARWLVCAMLETNRFVSCLPEQKPSFAPRAEAAEMA